MRAGLLSTHPHMEALHDPWMGLGAVDPMSATRTIRFQIGTAASQQSASSVPANAIITRAYLDMQSAGAAPYSAGTTIQIGRTGAAALLMDVADSVPTAAAGHIYNAQQGTPWGGAALPVLVTIAGAPGAGVGFVYVEYAIPDT